MISIIRAGGALASVGEQICSGSGVLLLLHSVDVELKVAGVLADAELKQFVDDRKQVIQRANGLEENGAGMAEDTTRSGQDQCVFDGRGRHATVIESSCEETIVATDM